VAIRFAVPGCIGECIRDFEINRSIRFKTNDGFTFGYSIECTVSSKSYIVVIMLIITDLFNERSVRIINGDLSVMGQVSLPITTDDQANQVNLLAVGVNGKS
jgi:hypothetical protein